VLAFARDRVAPKVREMDETGALDSALVSALFELGVMGVEIPAEYGGAGSSFFNACWPFKPSRASIRAWPCSWMYKTHWSKMRFLRWGSPEQKTRYCPKLASEWVGSYALSEAGSGSDAFALKARAERRSDRFVLNGRKLWITNAHESSLVHRVRQCRPREGLQGYHGVLGRAQLSRLFRRKKGRQAGHPRFQYLRALARRLRSATRERAR